MPKGKGLYTRKGAKGRKMYFRDGKMISEKSYRASLARRSPTTRRRSSPRRSNPKRKNMARRYRKPAMPHPSITGMAAGLSVAQYLNAGTATTGGGVIKQAADGNLNSAFTQLSKNAINLATSPKGREILSTSVVLATAGGLVRKWFPSVKLGGNKLYFKI